MSDKETAPPPYEPAFGDPSFWPVLLSHVMGGSIRQLASAEKMIRAQVECTAPQPAHGKNLAQELRRRCNTKLSLLHQSAWYEACNELEKLLAATPQVTPTPLEELCDSAIELAAELRQELRHAVMCMDRSCRQCNAIAKRFEGTSEQAPQELELEQEADGRWLAEFTRFHGVAAYGPTKEEAIRNAAKVLIESEQASPKCEKCGETLPHLYDENCTDYREREVERG